ncbi:MAG: hypothetical protein ACREEO_14380 [Phenylobacterium sp.]
MPHEGFSWKRVTQDERVAIGPLVFAGLLLTADAVGTADVTVYDGYDAGGRQFCTFRTPVSRTEPQGPPAPVHLSQGLFVDVGSNVEECVVIYHVLSAERPADG